MFSSITMASSTTKPTESVNAMSDRLSRLYPSRYMTTKVPTMDIGSATLGIAVAETLRRKRKITSTTRKSVSSSVNFTSFTDARIDCDRSNSSCSESEAGSCCWMTGSSFFTAATTPTVFVPGCFWTASTTERSSMYQAAVLSFSTPSVAFATSLSRTGRPSR